jgi:tRNA dimethylallyltransferase
MYDGGLLEEAARLRQDYAELSRTAREGIGYAEAMDCLAGRCSREEAMARTVLRTRQLAKRQRTWFRGQTPARWVEATPTMSVEEVANRVQEEWRRHGPTEIVE